MKHKKILMLTLFALLMATAVAQNTHRITKFNVKGAGTAKGQGTIGGGIVDDGSVNGYYYDSNSVTHGFLRSPAGKITTFDPTGSASTFPVGMNSTLAMVGYFLDSNTVYHGFTRSTSGKINVFDAKGAGTGQGQGTILEDINDKGEIAGFYFDSNGVLRAFVISSTGKVTKFTPPGVGTGKGQGAGIAGFDGLTNAGAIAVDGIDSSGVNHGYLRLPNGKFQEFDPSGSVNTEVTGINGKDTVIGIYFDSSGGLHGFQRTANKQITSIDYPKAAATEAFNINSSGAITGPYADSSGVIHGFIRSPGGSFTMFSVSGASNGTLPNSNNSTGSVTGNWVDSAGVNHGFIRQ